MSFPLEPLHECRVCGGLLNREHFAEIPIPRQGYVIRMEYCEFCNRGWESVWNVVDGQLCFEFQCQWDPRDKPIEFGKFIQRLNDQVGIRA